jgi:hemoglobin
MTPDEHASRAEQLLADALRRGRPTKRATLLATAALAHAELALYHTRHAGSHRRTGMAATHAADRHGTNGGTSSLTALAPTGNPLFARLKGTDGIAAVVGDFYRKVLGDIQLAHYFERTPMPYLQRHMVAFLVQATGGPKEYTGREMLEAHEHLNITARDFDRVTEHLMSTLREYGVAEADIDEVVRAIAPLRPMIVTQGMPVFPT